MLVERAHPLARLLFSVGPDLIALSGFIVVLAILWATYGAAPITLGHGSTLLPPLVMAALLAGSLMAGLRDILAGDAAARRRFVARALTVMRDWSPLIMAMVVYDNFHDLTRIVRPHPVDATLARLDQALFGVEPSLWLQPLTRPWLTEYLSFAYALLFVYPLVLLTLLYLRGQFLGFRELGLALSMAFYLGLIGFMLVPAVGPRYALADRFHVPLHGYWLATSAAAAWNSVEKVDRDCFPSLHTALSSIALVYLWRHRALGRGLLLPISLPLIVSLWGSTLYLRYHYAVDVLAGWALAVLCCYAAPAMMRWYYGSLHDWGALRCDFAPAASSRS